MEEKLTSVYVVNVMNHTAKVIESTPTLFLSEKKAKAFFKKEVKRFKADMPTYDYTYDLDDDYTFEAYLKGFADDDSVCITLREQTVEQ